VFLSVLPWQAMWGRQKNTGIWELWRLDMRGLGVPPVGVVQLVALGILLPKSSAMPHHRRLKRFLIKEERRLGLLD
jgi:hypothetical protein